MKEQSHKEEMSAAIRGDFRRLRERGVSASLVPQDAPEPDESPNGDVAAPEREVEAVVAPHEEAAPEPHAEPAPESPGEHTPEPPPESDDDATQPRRGWLSRLAGR
ncbi:MAG TPA: hypothetical protein VGF10_02500 [Gaiella sp.]|jgi:hypothetical protein